MIINREYWKKDTANKIICIITFLLCLPRLFMWFKYVIYDPDGGISQIISLIREMSIPVFCVLYMVNSDVKNNLSAKTVVSLYAIFEVLAVIFSLGECNNIMLCITMLLLGGFWVLSSLYLFNVIKIVNIPLLLGVLVQLLFVHGLGTGTWGSSFELLMFVQGLGSGTFELLITFILFSESIKENTKKLDM